MTNLAIIAIIGGMSLEPAKSVIEKVGGPAVVSKVTGRDVSRVYRWMYPRDRGGTGGFIPHEEARKLLDYAAEKGIGLTPDDFFPPSSPSSPSQTSDVAA